MLQKLEGTIIIVAFAGIVPADAASINTPEQPVIPFSVDVIEELAENVPVYASIVPELKLAVLP